MSPENDQKKSEQLARVRENQRKSRARKLEHIRELEQTLASSKEREQQKDIQHRLMVQSLEAENRKLRYLLSCSGLQPRTVDDYLRRVDDPATAQKVAIPALRRTEESSSSQTPEAPLAHPSTGTNAGATSEQPEQSTISATDQKISEPVEKPLMQESQPSSKRQSFCGCQRDVDSYPANQNVMNTTLCAIAEELVEQYNTRGLDMAEIQHRLRTGFYKGLAASEDCRVENHVLFQVLDEISNG